MERKWVHVLFAAGGVALFWLLSKSGEWAWSYFGRPNGLYVSVGAALVAGIATYVAWKNEEVFQLASEVTSELSKVSWPSRRETLNSTVVVIVTTIVASLVLGLFDAMWSYVTRLIYG